MNEIKKSLKLLTFLASLFAGTIAFAPSEEIIDSNPNWTETSHEDPIQMRERQQHEAFEKKEQEHATEMSRQNENLFDKATRTAKSAFAKGKEAVNKFTNPFKKPAPMRRSTGEEDESGTDLTHNPDHDIVLEKSFVSFDREPTEKNSRDLTTEEVEKLTAEDINKFTQQDIKDLNADIANLSPATFETLSEAQTAAITFDQLTQIIVNPELVNKLKVENINATELSKVFQYRNIGGKLPDEFVTRMTKDQINKILEENPKNLTEYFTEDQITQMKSKISLKDQLNRSVQKTTDWLNSTSVVKWLNKIANNDKDRQQASIMARSKANGTFDSADQEAFESHLKNLSTKDKESVANAWAEARTSQIQDIEHKIDAIKNSKLPSNERIQQINALKKDLNIKITTMDQDMIAFKNELQTTLTPNEVVIRLQRRTSKGFFESTKSNNKIFEIIDMSKIDPTQSIKAQYPDLKSTGFFGQADATVSHINPNDLQKEYGLWVANAINIDPSQPVAEQLETETARITGKSWSELDPSIKVGIFVELGKDIQSRFASDVQDKNIAGAAQAKTELQTIILAMNPSEIETLSGNEFKNIEPETVANFSKEQIQALNLDQIEALSPEQIKALDFTQLRSRTVSQLLSTMSAEKISTLTQEQIQGLPKGKFSATLAKLNTDDLKSIETAFKSTGNPFETTVTREITRKTANQSVDSYAGNFDVHRIAINNTEIISTRPENISKLSLDTIRDLDVKSIEKMSDNQINALTKEQLNVLNNSAINAIMPRLPSTAIANISPTEFSKINSTVLSTLTPEQSEMITQSQLTRLNPEQRSSAAKAIEKFSTAKAESLGLDLHESLTNKTRKSTTRK